MMTKQELDQHLQALVGPKLIEHWWENPNRNWGGYTPRYIYERDEAGKKEVEDYIMKYSYGDYY